MTSYRFILDPDECKEKGGGGNQTVSKLVKILVRNKGNAG